MFEEIICWLKIGLAARFIAINTVRVKTEEATVRILLLNAAFKPFLNFFDLFIF
jgi:hypothetical protein